MQCRTRPAVADSHCNPVGVASALRVHMGYIAGLVPGTKAASTCQVNAQGTRPPHPRCGSGPIISITSEEDRRLSLGLRRKESSEPRVNFSLPLSKYAQADHFPLLLDAEIYARARQNPCTAWQKKHQAQSVLFNLVEARIMVTYLRNLYTSGRFCYRSKYQPVILTGEDPRISAVPSSNSAG